MTVVQFCRQDVATEGGGTTLSGVTDREGFVAEFIFSFIYLHINYAMGLDPKQAPVYGPILGPAFCGVLVGMTIFISGNLQPGYGGAGTYIMDYIVKLLITISSFDERDLLQTFK